MRGTSLIRNRPPPQVMHPLHWMILSSFMMYLIHHVSEICHWLSYSRTGVGLPVAEVPPPPLVFDLKLVDKRVFEPKSNL